MHAVVSSQIAGAIGKFQEVMIKHRRCYYFVYLFFMCFIYFVFLVTSLMM